MISIQLYIAQQKLNDKIVSTVVFLVYKLLSLCVYEFTYYETKAMIYF